MNNLSEILSAYVTERDNFQMRYKGQHGAIFQPNSVGGPIAFSRIIDGHAARLSAALPNLSLAEWEALSELAASRLNFMRMREQGRRHDDT
jgi:hypothetical protein